MTYDSTRPPESEGRGVTDPPPSRPTLDLGRRIRETRLARNLTQSELADGIFSMSYISAVERGQIRPSLGALERLAQALQVPVEELLRTDITTAPTPGARPESASWMTSEEADYRLYETLMVALGGAPQDALQSLIALSDRRLSIRQRARLLWQMALCDVALGRGDEARRAAEEGLSLAERSGDAVLGLRVRLQLGRALSLLGNPQQALDLFRSCSAELEQGSVRDPALAFEALLAVAQTERALRMTDEAIAHLEQVERMAGESLAPEQLATAFRSLSASYFQQNDLAGADEYAVRSIAAYETVARRQQSIAASQQLATALVGVGRAAEAVSHLQAALAVAQERGDVGAEAALQTSLAQAYLQQQQSNEARAAAERAVALSQNLADTRILAQAELVLARVLGAAGDTQGEEHALEQAIELLRGTDAVAELGDAYARLSELLERTGNQERALEILKQAWRLRESGPSMR